MANEHRRSIRSARKGCWRLSLGLILYFTPLAVAPAEDWPGFLGKNRDAVAVGEAPLQPWKTPLSPRFQIPLGAGFSGATLANGRLFIAHRQGAQDHLDAYDALNGKQIWRTSFPASYSGGVDPDKGPRASAIVSDGQVFFYSAAADLHCVDAKDGKTLWSRSLGRDYELPDSYFGAGASPLVLDKLVVVSLGAKKGAAVVALDRATGETRWKAVDDEVSYSSPILVERNGAPMLIAALREKCVALSPDDGKLIFETPFGGRGPSVTAATPVVEGDKLFLTAEYQIGCAMLDLSKKDVPSIWENNESLTCHYTTPIFYKGHLYGARGREDYREGDLRCVDAATGKVLWEKEKLGVAHAIRIGEQILLVSVDGDLRLIDASPKAFTQHAQGSLGKGKFRAAPAYSNGRLYVRASLTPTSSELRCFELSPAK